MQSEAKQLILGLGVLAACSQMAAALPVFQIDVQRSGSPTDQETQLGWSAWDVDHVQTNNSITTTVAGIGITITSNGGGYVDARGGSGTDRGGEITDTSWDDMAEDFAVSREGDSTATVDFTNLDDSLTYVLTIHNNDPYVINSGFSGRTLTPSITTGTRIGPVVTGLITNVRPGSHTDADFHQTVISFTPDAGGDASILLSSSDNFVLLNGLELATVADSDGDGIDDDYELAHTDPPSTTALVPGLDDDNDGLTNLQEYAGQDATDTDHGFGQTLASVADSDGDGPDDGDEVSGALNPYRVGHVQGDPPGGVPGAPTDPNDDDSDDDTILDGEEITAGTDGFVTNPHDADTDGDTYEDGDELVAGANPTDATSFPPPPPGTVVRIDFHREGGDGQERQTGWDAWEVDRDLKPSSITNTIDAIGITVKAGGAGGYLTSRGGTADGRGGEITGTSWDDVVEECLVARAGDGTMELAFTGLGSAQDYTLTCFHNDPYTVGTNPGFATGDGVITPSITTGTVLGTPQDGQNTNVRPGDRTDGDFLNSVVSFTSDAAGNGTVLLTSTTEYVVVDGLNLTTDGPVGALAITDIVYSPDSDEVTLTWRSRQSATYRAFSSTDLSDWTNELDDNLGVARDEKPGDGNHITVTFLLDSGLETTSDLFFRIAEE